VKRALLAIAVGAVGWSATLLMIAAPAGAAVLHEFDPQLSLTGDCSSGPSTPPDTVPDPDCSGEPLEYPPAPARPTPFNNSCGVATDAEGYIYVANGVTASGAEKGWIDVFNPLGEFITEIDTRKDGARGACRLAVDSAGRVYVAPVAGFHGNQVLRYAPTSYPPRAGAEAEDYGPAEPFGRPVYGAFGIPAIAIDPSNDNVYLSTGVEVVQYAPNGDAVGGTNEIQTITVDATGGTFTVRFEDDTTTPIAATASAEEVEAALTQLSSLGPGAVEVTGGPGSAGGASPYVVEFVDSKGGANVEQLLCGAASLTGGAATCSVATTTQGDNNGFGADLGEPQGVDVWGRNHDVYVAVQETPNPPYTSGLAIYSGVDHHLLQSIPAVGRANGSQPSSVAVDQSNGDVYVTDPAIESITQFAIGNSGEYEQVASFGTEQELKAADTGGSDLAVDAPCLEAAATPCAGTVPYLSPNEGYVFVNSGIQAHAHLYAYAPLNIGPPVISAEEASGISTAGARLSGRVTPNGAPTTYRFEYVDASHYLASGWSEATVSGNGQVADGEAPATAVSTSVSGLSPDTTYHFRIVASNHCNPSEPAETCMTEGERDTGGNEIPRTFSTFPLFSSASECPNEVFRIGPSAALPDCRAYELVTPARGGVKAPNWQAEVDTQLTSVNGGSLLFASSIGGMGGVEGNGVHDVFDANRGAAGWMSAPVGPTGEQATFPVLAWASPSNSYGAWHLNQQYGGSLAFNPGVTDEISYLREPDGSFEFIGVGSLGSDPQVAVDFVSPNVDHIIFSNRHTFDLSIPLESNAPPEGTKAVYDRAPGGETHVVSLLPNNVTPSAGEDAFFLGASADGSSVAFRIGDDSGTTYVRRGNTTTRAVGAGVTFGGLSHDGRFLFYLQAGDVFRFDVESGQTQQIGSGGASTIVNLSADGSAAYFVSTAALTGNQRNAFGAKATVGAQNLYSWIGSSDALRFIGAVAPSDLTGGVNLGKWIGGTGEGPAAHRGSAVDPSRSTADGGVIVFESRASVTGYPNQNHLEIYRYVVATRDLTCLSCLPTGVAATSDARLQDVFGDVPQFVPLTAAAPVTNIANGGANVFFESDERLVPRDTDGTTDVYEWTQTGFGGCSRSTGCLALISSGQSGGPNYLYAVTPTGSDVFFRTGDSLVGRDTDDGQPSIYDARVNGGFAEPPLARECLGGACQGAGASPAPFSTPGSAALHGPENVKPAKRRSCGHGKHRVHRHGKHKGRCVRNRRHHQHAHHHRGHSHRRNGGQL
jgi:ribosomal protein S11